MSVSDISSATMPVVQHTEVISDVATKASGPSDVSEEPETQTHEPVVLDDKQKAAALKQIEFYFSDLALPFDSFLKEQIKKDPEGFVNLALIMSFKKMAPYQGAIDQVAEILRSSSHLVVSEDNTKVRRKTELSTEVASFDERKRRSLVFEGYPFDKEFAFASGFIDYLEECLKACKGEGKNIDNIFARVDSRLSQHISGKNKKGAFVVEFSQLEYAQTLLKYFQSNPCSFESKPIEVCSYIVALIKNPHVTTTMAASEILKISGFPEGFDEKAVLDTLKKVLDDSVQFVASQLVKDSEVEQLVAYAGFKDCEAVSKFLEKINTPIVPKAAPEKTLTESATVSEGAPEAPSTEMAVESCADVAEPTPVVESEASKENTDETSTENRTINLVAAIPTESEAAEACFLFQFSEFCPFPRFQDSKKNFKRANSKNRNNSSKPFKKAKKN